MNRRIVKTGMHTTHIACFLALVVLAPRLAWGQYRYAVDGSDNKEVYVVAYEALSYSVNGGIAVNVPANTVAPVTDATGSPSIIELSATGGYVYTRSQPYSEPHPSNDRLILVRGETGYTDTKFLVHNPARNLSGVNYGKIVVTALDEDADVTITGPVAQSFASMGAGTAFVTEFTDSGVATVTSTKKVTVHTGVFSDGYMELAPTLNNYVVGAEAYVAVPEVLGVVALGDGKIAAYRRYDSGGQLIEETLFEGNVTKGQAIYLPYVHNTSSTGPRSYSGVTTVRISGTNFFYAFTGMANPYSYLGSMAIPPDPDPSWAGHTHFYVQSLHPAQSSVLDVVPYETGTAVTVTKVGGTETLTPTVSDEIRRYTIPASTLTNAAGGKVETTWEVEADKPVAVYLRHAIADERGTIVLSPDYTPPIPPSVTRLDVTSVQHVPDALDPASRSYYLRVVASVLDINRDLTTLALTGPDGQPVKYADGSEVNFDQFADKTPGVGLGFARIEINSNYFNITQSAFNPGTYTLTASDEGGNTRVVVDVIRNLPMTVLVPAINNIPVSPSKDVSLAPIYAWYRPPQPYASNYRVEVATSNDFGLESRVLGPDQTKTAGLSVSHASRAAGPLALGTLYYWRVYASASTIQYGEDNIVVGPTWSFTTIAADDFEPPEFTADPQVLNVDEDLITVKWVTDEPARAYLRYGAAGWTGTGYIAEFTLSEYVKEYVYTFRSTGGLVRQEIEIEAVDAKGNSRKSNRVSFIPTAIPDTEAPKFVAGPEVVSVTENSARIAFGTDEPAASQLVYYIKGVNPAAEPEKVEEKAYLDEFILGREIELTSLVSDTAYFYQVKVLDQKNNLNVSPILNFRTRVMPDRTAPRILGGVRTVEIGDTRAIFAWNTNEGAKGRIVLSTNEADLEPGATPISQGTTEDILSTVHRVEVTNIQPGAKYFYAAVSTDASFNADTSDVMTFTTRAAPDVTPPNIAPPGTNPVTNRTVDMGKVLNVNVLFGRPEPIAEWNSAEEVVGTVYVVSPDSTRGPDSLFADQNRTTFTVQEYALSHRVVLRGLAAGADYWAQIVARDRAGNVRKGYPIPFSTPAVVPPDVVPPEVDADLSSVTPGKNEVRFHVVLNEPGDVRIFYGTEHLALTNVVASLEKKIEHTIVVPELAEGTTYFYIRQIADRAGNVNRDTKPLDFETTRPLATTIKFHFSGHPSLVASQLQQILEGLAQTLGVPVLRLQVTKIAGVNVFVQILPAGRLAADGEDALLLQSPTPSLEHNIPLHGLGPGATYAIVAQLTSQSGEQLTWPPGAEVTRTATGYRVTKLGRASQTRFGGTFQTAATEDATYPTIIEGPTVVARTKTSAFITWRTDEPADTRLRFATSQPGAGRLAQGDELENEIFENDAVTEHAVLVNGLDENQTYLFEVGATDLGGNGETVSDRRVFSTLAENDVITPTITEGPTIVSKTDTRASIRWVTDEPADTKVFIYPHEEGEESGLSLVVPGLSAEHVVNVTGLTANTEYDLRVHSSDANQNGPAVGTKNFTTENEADTQAPIFVSAPAVVNASDVSATIRWGTDEPADTYLEYGATQALGFIVNRADLAEDHSVVLSGLQAGTEYFFRVQAQDGSGNITEGPILSFTTAAQADTDPPATPQNFTVTPGYEAAFLSWDANTEGDFAGYEVERSTDGTNFTILATGYRKTSYLDKSLSNGAPYHYRIRARDNSTNRNASPYTAVGTTTPEASHGPQAPALIDYTYDPNNPVTGYPIFRYFEKSTGNGKEYRPVFRVGNVPPGPGPKMSYTFVVATDAEFRNIVATGSNVAPGDTNVGAVDSWFYALVIIKELYPAYFDITLDVDMPDSTSWIPSTNLTPGITYYWRARANDGIFDSPWSNTDVFSAATTVLEIAPERAEHHGIVLEPEKRPVVSVRLVAFAATGSPDGVTVLWKLTGDDKAQGVYLRRSRESEDVSSFQRLAETPLPLEGSFADRSAQQGVTYFYRLEVVYSTGEREYVGLTSGSRFPPTTFTLGANRPNPFNPVTVIPYSLPGESQVTLSIYDVTGRLVRTLVNRRVQGAGYYQVTWDGTDHVAREVGSGVYLCRIVRTTADGGRTESLHRRMVLIR